ncbi:MAG: TIGR04372 family glycosyltransferase [Acidobacteriota bacterium]|nr:TIGR04372 family glycosyltransferase [Acidobacteriota bacterium]
MTSNRLLLLVGQLWAVPLLFIVRLIRPFILIRMDALSSEYFGHYAGNVELYLCERELGINRPARRHLDLWFNLTPVVSNHYLERMWKRHLTILPRALLSPIHRLNRIVPFGAAHQIVPTYYDRDVRNLLESQPPHLRFTPEEEARGRQALIEMGVPPGARFVCVNVRDGAFHKDKAFTNYRNADVSTYLPAAEELARRGYYVIRMGKTVEQRFTATSDRVIDYANSPWRNDFMDLYLGATCYFTVSTSSGWDNVPGVLFRRPVVYTNVVPISQIQTWNTQTMAIPKRHWSETEQRFLTLREIFHLVDRGFVSSHPPFAEQRITVVDNTPEEILDTVVEMADWLESGRAVPAAGKEALQAEFWRLYRLNLERNGLQHLHGAINVSMSTRFLETAKELTDDTSIWLT